MPEHETCSIGDCRLLFLASIQPNNVNVLVSMVGFYVKARDHSDWVCGAAIMAQLSQGEEESRKGSCDHRIASEVIYTATSLLNARTPKPILDGALAKDLAGQASFIKHGTYGKDLRSRLRLRPVISPKFGWQT